MTLSDALRHRIDELVRSHDVVLFMKGDRRAPQCGFSASVVAVLDALRDDYRTVDVLADPELREGIKAYSEWPTLPQLYVRGRFVGGADIVREMHAAGEMAPLLGAPAVAAPTITLTEAAAQAIRAAADEGSGEPLHLEISPDFRYDLFFAPRAPGDVAVTSAGLTLLLDRDSARRADGLRVDYVETPQGAGFRIDNPHAPPRVRALSPRELKAMLDRGAPLELLDVRTEAERAVAAIAGARLLDAATAEYLDGLDRDTTLVFQCHHGVRSLAAAERFLRAGFRNVYNLTGGIDAWSTQVDPAVPRY